MMDKIKEKKKRGYYLGDELDAVNFLEVGHGPVSNKSIIKRAETLRRMDLIRMFEERKAIKDFFAGTDIETQDALEDFILKPITFRAEETSLIETPKVAKARHKHKNWGTW